MKHFIPFTLFLLTNLSLIRAEIIINEIHYNSEPNNNLNEFIELYNSGTDTLDLSGWFFSDGINFQFNEGALIEANSFIVISEDPESLQNTLQKVTNSSHLNKVNQSQRRPLIPSNFTESARKQIKPCAQIRCKTLPLSKSSTMRVELGIDLQLRNWKPCATNGENRL